MTANPTDEDTPQTESNPADADAIADAIKQACAEDEAAQAPADSLEVELATEKDRVLRLQAEMENLRTRTAREVNEERRYAAMPIVRDLLPVVDNIDRAIEAAQQSGEATSLLEGFKLVRQQLITTLEQHHCKPIEAVGQPFDPQVHEAILQQPSDEQPANHVLQQTQTGYQLHDRVVRAAQVIISTGPAE
ncbi:MAG: nucleotide exchange factor GrpE [Planctomycetota bacterium]